MGLTAGVILSDLTFGRGSPLLLQPFTNRQTDFDRYPIVILPPANSLLHKLISVTVFSLPLKLDASLND